MVDDIIPQITGAAFNDAEELDRQLEAFTGRLFKDDSDGTLLLSRRGQGLLPLHNTTSLYTLIPREFTFLGERGAGLPSSIQAMTLLGALKQTAAARLQRVVSRAHLLYNAHDERWHQPGDYDPTTGSIGIGPSHPTTPVDGGYPHLRALFSGVYTDQAARDRLMVLACLMYGRVGLPEFPLLLIDAKAKNSGKTRVATALRTLVTGRDGGSVNSLERLNQQLGSLALAPGPHVVTLDNLTRKIFSSHLSSAVHQENIHVEPKYKGVQPVFSPVFVLTANNTRLDTDLADKAIMVMLEAPAARGERLSLMDPDPQTYARRYRHEIVNEIRSVLMLAQPPARGDMPGYQTRFVDWERAAAGVAEQLGVRLDLGRELADSSDQVALELWAAYDEWLTRPSSARVSPGAPLEELVGIIKENTGRLKALWYELTVRGTIAGPQLERNLAQLVTQKLSRKSLTIDGKCGIFKVVHLENVPIAIERRSV